MAITLRKRIALPAIAALAVLTVGGGVAWAAFEDERALAGGQRERVEQAALAEVGGGRVLDAEADDEAGQRLYEVEVVDADGVEWDVVLDDELAVVLADREDDATSVVRDDDSDDVRGDDSDLADDTADPEDAPVSAADRERVGAAAAAAVSGGKAIDVDRGDRAGIAWEVEVVDGRGRDWDVSLDDRLEVLDTVRD